MDPRLAQFPPLSVSANPPPSSWAPLNLICVGGIPEQEGAQAFPPLDAKGAHLVARGENTLPPACLCVFTCARTRGTGKKSPVRRQQCWTTSHYVLLLGRGLRPQGSRKAQLMRNTHAGSLRVGSGHHSSWPVLTGLAQGCHDASAHSKETHPPGVMLIYSPGDPARSKKTRLLPSHCLSGRIQGPPQSVSCSP